MGTHTESPRARPVIVGVTPDQPPHVVLQAARFAAQFGTDLVCAHVNPGRFVRSESDDGTVETASLDPDFADERETTFHEPLADSIAQVLTGSEVGWRTLTLAGDVTTALSRLADTLDASMIVVGSHEGSLGGTIQEFFGRSVAATLSHQQPRPVVVIPSKAPPATERGAPGDARTTNTSGGDRQETSPADQSGLQSGGDEATP
ncbi:universal stress protein [Salinibacterium hongtaonis]|uniref:Universal stress protein n=1 Tax=Homoserinimonas hongtaonis TaxID=2079791 RepID=A0A2U1SY15_9MICO|nr:universal stress protein [Salinibacterium hongtaonis]PWB96433.1 universal stress protein [Salinibacterium hongtaonis]